MLMLRSIVTAALCLFLTCLIASPQAVAFGIDKPLDDPAQEERALTLNKALRCLVCQNQSISDSDAPLAKDLRILVRERVAAGDDDAEVLDFITARYGDWVLLRPPVKPNTWLLWLAPILLLAIALIGFRLWYRRPAASATPAPLNADEQARVAALLEEQDSKS